MYIIKAGAERILNDLFLLGLLLGMCFCFQAEDGIRVAQESRGLGDVYKRQASVCGAVCDLGLVRIGRLDGVGGCLLYTSDAADDLTRVDLGGSRMIIKKK